MCAREKKKELEGLTIIIDLEMAVSTVVKEYYSKECSEDE